jgi:hypothetical protein
MTEKQITKQISSFSDVVEVIKDENKYIVRINEIEAGDKEFNDLNTAREYAETKKTDLDFRHVLMLNDKIIEVSVYSSWLTTLQKELEGSQIIKISIAEAKEMGLE